MVLLFKLTSNHCNIFHFNSISSKYFQMIDYFLFCSYFVCMCACVSSLGSFNEYSMFLFLTINKQKYNITNNKTVPIEWWQREMFFSFSYNFNIRHLVAGEFFFYFLLGAQYTYKYMYMHTFNNYTHKKTKISSSYHFHNQLY